MNRSVFRNVIIIGCLIGAVGLLLAASQQSNTDAEQQWVQLNAEIEARLTLEGDALGEDRMEDEEHEMHALKDKQETDVSEELGVEVHQDQLIDINHATLDELQRLKGIGPAKAQAIIDERELGGAFVKIEDLQRVKGIGQKTIDELKGSIVALP